VNGERGFSYLGLLAAIALAGVALAAAGVLWSTEAKRERERELLFVGDQFRAAIASYAAATPPGSQTYPTSLEQLVEDRRWPTPRRHLRRIYPDPMTGSTHWGLVRNAQGGIVGVHSTAEEPVLKRANFPPAYAAFANEGVYSRWIFRDTSAPGPRRADDAAQAGGEGGADASAERSTPPPGERPVPSLREDVATRSPEACQRIGAADAATCAEVETIVGAAAAAICRESAARRAAVCTNTAAPLPGLFYPRTRETAPPSMTRS
jgi:type II secretory pathway pseudopilin PulG